MTEEQKRDYKLYRKECRFSGVEPVRKDFLAGDIPSCVIFHMELTRQMEAAELTRQMAEAAMGRQPDDEPPPLPPRPVSGHRGGAIHFSKE